MNDKRVREKKLKEAMDFMCSQVGCYISGPVVEAVDGLRSALSEVQRELETYKQMYKNENEKFCAETLVTSGLYQKISDLEAKLKLATEALEHIDGSYEDDCYASIYAKKTLSKIRSNNE